MIPIWLTKHILWTFFPQSPKATNSSTLQLPCSFSGRVTTHTTGTSDAVPVSEAGEDGGRGMLAGAEKKTCACRGTDAAGDRIKTQKSQNERIMCLSQIYQNERNVRLSRIDLSNLSGMFTCDSQPSLKCHSLER